MKNPLSNVFLISDVDGTLLNTNHEISEKNLSAIRELKAAGGKFSIATGRGMSMAIPIVAELDLDEPAVIFNGSVIYDYTKNKILWQSSLTKRAYSYITQIHQLFPTAAVEVLRGEKVYVPFMNDLERQHLKLGNVEPVICELDEIPADGWLKTLVVDEPQNIDKIIEYAKENLYNEVHWVRSSPVYYECLPIDVNKGSSFKKLLQITNDENRFTVGVGDFMNDYELIKFSDLGVATGNAEEEIKRAADFITADNDSHAIYEVIEYLKYSKIALNKRGN